MSAAKWFLAFGAVAGVLVLTTMSPNTAELGATFAALLATGVLFAHWDDLAAFIGASGSSTPSVPNSAAFQSSPVGRAAVPVSSGVAGVARSLFGG